jgi:uncharacterized protein (DUF433 family)
MTGRAVVVHSDPEILGGTPVFVGTRVPLKNLFDYLERGYDLNEFSMNFRQCRGNRPLRSLKTLTRS